MVPFAGDGSEKIWNVWSSAGGGVGTKCFLLDMLSSRCLLYIHVELSTGQLYIYKTKVQSRR